MLFQLFCETLVLGIDKLSHDSGHAAEHVDRRIMAAIGKVARQNHMAVERGARDIADRLGEIVALDQDRVKPRDMPFSARPARSRNSDAARKRLEDSLVWLVARLLQGRLRVRPAQNA